MLNLSEKEKQNALNEVRLLASVKYLLSPSLTFSSSHTNVIGYKEAFIDE
jgi:hypothetical protein